MNLLPLPAFNDNYIWLLHDRTQAVVVDPGDAAPVLAALRSHGLNLQAIVLTHHHGDHVGGVAALHEATGGGAQIYGPADETLPGPRGVPVQPVRGGRQVQMLGLQWQVLDVPGHTAGHIAWYAPDAPGGPVLFCGDVLFAGGCGRVFEGTPQQMYASLQTLAALPPQVQVCCAHEYTLANLRFALAVEPDNTDIRNYLAWCEARRQNGQPTLPTLIGRELAINPFLRCTHASVVQAAQRFAPHTDPSDPASVFAALRAWKNEFRA